MCRADSRLTEEDKIKVSHAKASFQEAFWSSWRKLFAFKMGVKKS